MGRIFSTELNETNANVYIWNKIEDTTFADFDLFDFSSFIFKNLALSLKKAALQKKNIIAEERLDGIDMDDIGNLEDSMMVKNLPEILTKTGSRKFYN